MTRRKQNLLLVVLGCSCVLAAQQQVAIQKGTAQLDNPSSGGYQPPALPLMQLMRNDPLVSGSLLSVMQSGDSRSFRTTIIDAAQAGNIVAELLLAEQYIP